MDLTLDWFDLTIFGQNGPLKELQQWMAAAMAECCRGNDGDFALAVDQLFPDVRGDATRNCIGLHQMGCDANGPTPFDLKPYELMVAGVSKRATWFAFLQALSKKYPDMTFRVSANNHYGRHEEWTAHNGTLAVVEMRCTLIWNDLRIVYIRNGIELDSPEFEGKVPVEIAPADLLRICVSTWHSWCPDRDCPGEKSGALRQKAEEYVARRLGQGEPPSEEVFQLWQEIAAKPKDDDVV